MSRSTRKAHVHGLLEVTYVSLGINSVGKASYQKLMERKWGRTIGTHSWILGEYELDNNDGTHGCHFRGYWGVRVGVQ